MSDNHDTVNFECVEADHIRVKTLHVINKDGDRVATLDSFGDKGCGLWIGDNTKNHVCIYVSGAEGPVIGIRRPENTSGLVDVAVSADGIQLTNGDEVVNVPHEVLFAFLNSLKASN